MNVSLILKENLDYCIHLYCIYHLFEGNVINFLKTLENVSHRRSLLNMCVGLFLIDIYIYIYSVIILTVIIITVRCKNCSIFESFFLKHTVRDMIPATSSGYNYCPQAEKSYKMIQRALYCLVLGPFYFFCLQRVF